MANLIAAILVISLAWWLLKTIVPALAVVVVLVGGCYVIYRFLFWITHRRPLTEDEMERLSSARRVASINKTYSFTHNVVRVNPDYRASLNKEGRWDRVSIPLGETLSLLTQMLRYKRHEWSVWCIADETECKYVWANKGDDNVSCYFKGSMAVVAALAETSRCNTLIHMHNHPHTQERTWNLLSPSETDLETLQHMSQVCEGIGLNFVDALCSQGKFIVFGWAFPDQYYPAGSSVEEVRIENGISKAQNFRLHTELAKIRNEKISIAK